MEKQKLPNFFIVGTSKAGTSSLYYFLTQHPDVFMPALKEPHFFCYNDYLNTFKYNRFKQPIIGDFDRYKLLFKTVHNEKAVGEATAHYLYFPSTPLNIRNTIPEARIIIVLREPVSRAFSHYLFDLKGGRINRAFEDVVFKKVANKDKDFEYYYVEYVKLGFYYEQVKRYLDVFGQDNVKIFLFDDLRNDASRVLKTMLAFLDVDTSINIETNRIINKFKLPKNVIIRYLYSNYNFRQLLNRKLPYALKKVLIKELFVTDKPGIDKNTNDYLKALYREDVIHLQDLIGKDLGNWIYIKG